MATVAAGVPAQEWLTTADFAVEAGKAEFTVRAWCWRKRINADKKSNGREWQIHRNELERYRRDGLLPE